MKPLRQKTAKLGINVHITNGKNNNVLTDLLANKTVTTNQGISLEPWGFVIIEEK